jgi:hypothetical protein
MRGNNEALSHIPLFAIAEQCIPSAVSCPTFDTIYTIKIMQSPPNSNFQISKIGEIGIVD